MNFGLRKLLRASLASDSSHVVVAVHEILVGRKQSHERHRVYIRLRSLIEVQVLLLDFGSQNVIDFGYTIFDELAEAMLCALNVMLRPLQQHSEVRLHLLHHVVDLVRGQRASTVDFSHRAQRLIQSMA